MTGLATRDEQSVDMLTRAFSQVFAVPKPRPFGGWTAVHHGVSDNAEGVQWNAAVDRERGVTTLGVNLEGMKYGDRNWPIANFVEREQARPGLLDLIATLHDAEHSELWFSRDAWQGAGARPPIAEGVIGKVAPISLAELTTEKWKEILTEAYGCLDPNRSHRGRALQWVTLPKAGRREMTVSPHLQLKRVIWRTPPTSFAVALEAMQREGQHLLEIYRFVATRSM
jgi:hypothetical protein